MESFIQVPVSLLRQVATSSSLTKLPPGQHGQAHLAIRFGKADVAAHPFAQAQFAPPIWPAPFWPAQPNWLIWSSLFGLTPLARALALVGFHSLSTLIPQILCIVYAYAYPYPYSYTTSPVNIKQKL